MTSESTETIELDNQIENSRTELQTTASPLYTEPAVAKITYGLVWAIISSSLIIVALIGACIFLYLRKPDRIVIEQNSQGEQLLMINDRNYGQVKNLALEPDKPTNGQKLLFAKEFVTSLFEADVTSRQAKLKRALGMMAKESAQTLFNYLKTNTANGNNNAGIALTIEKQENWSSLFEIKESTLDSSNPAIINILGTQKITKVIGGNVVQDERNVQIKLTVHPDSEGRQDYNLQLGFLVLNYSFKELPK